MYFFFFLTFVEPEENFQLIDSTFFRVRFTSRLDKFGSHVSATEFFFRGWDEEEEEQASKKKKTKQIV